MVGYVTSMSMVRISDMAKNTKYSLSGRLLLSKTQSVEEEYYLTLNKERCIQNSSRNYWTSTEMYERSSPPLLVLQALIWLPHCFRLPLKFWTDFFKKKESAVVYPYIPNAS